MIADEEVRKPDVTLAVLHGGVVVVYPLGEVRGGPEVPVADIEVTKACNVLVVIDSVVSGLSLLEPV